MSHSKLVGARLPNVRLCEMIDGQLQTVRASEVFGRGLAIVAGMPGAFTPICTEKHLPSLLRNADRLRAAGFTDVACIVTSNPFAVDAWARNADPERKVRFLSDGNLTFTRALNLTTHEPRIFLGECSKRYLLTVRDGAIESAREEDSILNLSCTNPDSFVLEIA